MAAGVTYELIESRILSSAVASLTFATIPGTYTDLVLSCNLGQVAAANVQIQYNGDTSSNYSSTVLYTVGSGVPAAGQYAGLSFTYGLNAAAALPNTISASGTIEIFSYANPNVKKTCLTRYGNSEHEQTTFVGTWRNTAAITSITVSSYSGSYLSGSSFALYGIKAA